MRRQGRRVNSTHNKCTMIFCQQHGHKVACADLKAVGPVGHMHPGSAVKLRHSCQHSSHHHIMHLHSHANAVEQHNLQKSYSSPRPDHGHYNANGHTFWQRCAAPAQLPAQQPSPRHAPANQHVQSENTQKNTMLCLAVASEHYVIAWHDQFLALCISKMERPCKLTLPDV